MSVGEHILIPEDLLQALECLDELAEFITTRIPAGDQNDELALSKAMAAFESKYGRRARGLPAWIDRMLKGHGRAGRPRKAVEPRASAQRSPQSASGVSATG